ncbi:MAG: peptidoglycan DD-metalloendopeptidase family protein [Paracoccaceae bacterium]
MKTRYVTIAMGLGLTGLLIACTPNKSANPANVDIRGSDPNQALQQTGPNTLNNSVTAGPDANGIVTYDGYQTARARGGDTVSKVAERVGLSATQLGSYNGLPATHVLRDGDELALPPRPGGYGENGPRVDVTAPSSGQQVAAAAVTPSTPTIQQTPLDGTPVNEDGTVTAAAPQTAPSAPPAPSAPAAAGDPGWSPDLAAAAIARSNGGIRNDGTLGAPPSSAAPVPPEPAPKRELESPGLSQYQTEESAGVTSVPATKPDTTDVADGTEVAAASQATASAPPVKMRRPVNGPVAIGFNKGSGPARNDGVDFAAPAGAKVVAAMDGEIALVSQSLGGLGTIVLMRHRNELLTVYGRVDGVLVKKGDIVQAGQQIGIVSNAAAPAEPRMHFEVRRGSESLDPMQFLS